jgi:hypothetical protein
MKAARVNNLLDRTEMTSFPRPRPFRYKPARDSKLEKLARLTKLRDAAHAVRTEQMRRRLQRPARVIPKTRITIDADRARKPGEITVAQAAAILGRLDETVLHAIYRGGLSARSVPFTARQRRLYLDKHEVQAYAASHPRRNSGPARRTDVTPAIVHAMRVVDGLEIREIAKRLRCGEKTVRRRLDEWR